MIPTNLQLFNLKKELLNKRFLKIFTGETVFIYGGGPSLPNIVKGRNIKHPVIGINHAILLGVRIDICFFGDSRFYWAMKDEFIKHNIIKISCDRRSSKISDTAIPDSDTSIIKIPYSNGHGVHIQKDKINFNSSSGGATTDLAIHLGASRIVLVGFDMHWVDGKSNWHPHVLQKTNKPYTNFIKPFEALARDAKYHNVEILNATPNSLLPYFKFTNFEDYV
jgi:hypothetical protein